LKEMDPGIKHHRGDIKKHYEKNVIEYC